MLWPHLDRGRPCLLPERTCLGCPMIVEGLVSNLGQNFNVLAKSSMLALFLATAACGSDGYSWGIGGPGVPGGGSGSGGSGSGGSGGTGGGRSCGGFGGGKVVASHGPQERGNVSGHSYHAEPVVNTSTAYG